MPISNRPNLEAFINKGGSSTGADEKKAPAPKKPKPVKSEISATQTVALSEPKKAEKPAAAIARVQKPAKSLGRPRKVRPADEIEALKFVMRIPFSISEELNRVVDGRKIPISRNAWILEAIVERLEREK